MRCRRRRVFTPVPFARSSQPTAINTVCGAPDPTAGASANDQTNWYLDEKTLHENIKKILIKFCLPAPMVFSDVNYLTNSAPPAAAEWSSLLRPLRGREPEGMWNLLSIIREMYRRCDRNAIRLLEIITEECMACDQTLVWWFNTKLSLLVSTSGHNGGKHSNTHSNSSASQHACSSLLDEIVVLWRLAALNPGLAPEERDMLHAQFTAWHLKVLDRIVKCRVQTSSYSNKHQQHLRSEAELFVGFKPAIEACYLDWEDYPIMGITHTHDTNPMYHCPFTCFKSTDSKGDVNCHVNSSQAVLSANQKHYTYIASDHHQQMKRSCRQYQLSSNSSSDSVNDRLAQNERENCNRSSTSSEGFCENDDDGIDSNGASFADVGITVSSDALVSSCTDKHSDCPLNDELCGKLRFSQPGCSSAPPKAGGSKTPNIGCGLGECSMSLSSGDDFLKSASGKTASAAKTGSSTSRETNEHDEPRPSTSKAAAETPKAKEGEKGDERKPSKDESSSSSTGSQQSVDEYNIYCYDSSKGYQQRLQEQYAVEKAKIEQGNKAQIFSNIRPTEDAWDILFARAEGLHAHGHGREACILAVRLAEELLANPPNLMIEIPQPVKQRKGKKQIINPVSHQLSVLASGTLAKGAFLCTVLAENSEHYHLAFRICVFGLEMKRPPASTKPLEVKLANQEADLLALLKRIPLGMAELRVIRERAEQLKDGTLRSRGEALLPIMLASFIFDALVMPSVSGKETRTKVMNLTYRLPTDENLGFEAAVAALGLKANVSEAEHPLLCEGTRRQRGDLALTLLYYYKDEPRRIAKIMEKLLDREIHTLIKSPLLPAYYSSNPPVRMPSSQPRRDEQDLAAQYPNEYYQGDYGMNNCGGGGSRPHSSTSAEFDLSMSAMTISQSYASSPMNAQPIGATITNTSSRIKDSRYKGKRAYPSIPNQPSEASAHFMFELAKNVLTKAGGSSSTQLFMQAAPNQNMVNPHKTLHTCAFQLGLYALGLHNCVSPNWLSRTYSSHVSWILGQAMEIGSPAISFLIDTWEGHLTPPEAAGMADRASRGWDNNMIYPAAELALSVLPHSAALNPNEIQRAILQCKEQSDQMLERACLTVENAAKGGGVYPEVLFQVARYWYELYLKNSPGGEHEYDDLSMVHLDQGMQLCSLMEHHEMPPQQQQPQQPQPPAPNGGGGQVVVTSAPPVPSQFPANPSVNLPHYGPYSFPCQGIFHHHNISYPPSQMPMYISSGQSFPYPAPPQPNHTGPAQGPSTPFVPPPYQSMQHPPIAGQPYTPMPCAPNVQQFPVQMQLASGNQPANNVPIQPNMQFFGPHPPPNQQMAMPMTQAPPAMRVPMQQPPNTQAQGQPNQHGTHHGGIIYPYVSHASHQQPPNRQRHPLNFNQTQHRYLMAAYNVGMLAMETLARRVHDDRPQAKYARNPPYGEDVKWLLQISKKLGTQYLHQFCVCAVNSIVSPFVLHDVAIEAAHYLARNNPTLVMQHLRSALTPLVQKCQQMYAQVTGPKGSHSRPVSLQVHPMHPPETVSFDAARLRGLLQHHSGSAGRVPNHT